jgi:hypothetical protein
VNQRRSECGQPEIARQIHHRRQKQEGKREFETEAA